MTLGDFAQYYKTEPITSGIPVQGISLVKGDITFYLSDTPYPFGETPPLCSKEQLIQLAQLIESKI